MKAIIIFLSLVISLGIISCDTNEPPTNSIITLKLEEVSCIEAWIELTTTNLQLPATITLKQINPTGETKYQILNLNTQDSLLYIDSLLPNKSYQYQVSSIENPATSNKLSVTTMDTTSHNFTFETFTFGGTAGSSVLYDVAIINENDIWAVGEIYIADTSINGYTTYNAVHWDGNEWELKRIYYYGNCSAVEYPPLKAIWVFSANNIVITNGGSIGWFNGTSVNLDCGVNPLLTGAINKIWGSSSNDLYVVGNNGNIARYLNGTWSRIESGTTTNINDVWGLNDKDGLEKIYCAVSFVFQVGDQKILTIKNNKVDSLSWNTGRRIHSVWTCSNSYLYTAGGGIFENKRGYWNEVTEVPLYYSDNIRGTEINNIFVCGDFGLFAHFNGSTWKTYNELYIQGIYFSVTVKNNMVITVGLEGNRAIIVKGTRN
jgi:hypothetical protein